MGIFKPVTDAEIELARQRVLEVSEEAIAESITIDQATRQVTLWFPGGRGLVFPLDDLRELDGATAEELGLVRVAPGGYSITCAPRDVDIDVEGLVLDLLAPGLKRALRQQLNREIARSGSAARTIASRENGKLGGRPRKAAVPAVAVAAKTPGARRKA
jgi:hypothetical protein